jgi:lipopolysaccharide transport system ATP-binding protein
MQAIPQLDGFLKDGKVKHSINVSIQLPPLIPNKYLVSIWVGSHNTETLDEVKEAVMFEIHDSPTSQRSFPHTTDHGYIVPMSTLNVLNSSLAKNQEL